MWTHLLNFVGWVGDVRILGPQVPANDSRWLIKVVARGRVRIAAQHSQRHQGEKHNFEPEAVPSLLSTPLFDSVNLFFVFFYLEKKTLTNKSGRRLPTTELGVVLTLLFTDIYVTLTI